MSSPQTQTSSSQLFQHISRLSIAAAFALMLLSLLSLTSAHIAYAAPACSSGFVWRVATPQDLVCVTPQMRSLVAYDNSQANVRRSPNGGPYGPDTCVQGYVWREAFTNDHVCVFPSIRSATASDNLREQLLTLINQDRAAHSLPAYGESPALANGAYQHSIAMARQNTLAHVLPGEPSPGQRIANDGIQTNAWGENIGYSSFQPDAWGGVQVIERNMMGELPPNDGHRQNLLSTQFTQVGIGVVIDSKHVVWVTEDFIK